MLGPGRLPASAGEVRSDARVGGLIAAGVVSAALFAIPLQLSALFLLAVVSPFPLLRERLRGGLGSAVLATALATTLVAGLYGPRAAALFFLPLALPGLITAEAMARGRGMVRGCAWAFAVVTLQVGLLLVVRGEDVASHALEAIDTYRSAAFLDQMRTSGVTAEQVEQVKEQVTQLREALVVVYPAVCIILGGLVVLANAVVLRLYLVRSDPGWLEGGEFETLRWPLALAVGFVAAGAGVALAPLRPAAYNALLVVGFFCALQGLAVVAFYARRLAGPPLLRGLLVLMVLVNPWAPQALALLGLFDLFLDFRKWAAPAEKGEGS
jgi:uncharacterized protein YybS (DUF2232 family)